MEKNKIYLFAGGLIIVALFAADTIWSLSGNNNTTSQKELFTLRARSPDYGFDPVVVGDELGYFREQGIKIDYVGLKEGDYIVSVVSGSMEVGAGHTSRVISGIAGGAKITAVAGSTKTIPGYPHMALYVPENSDIKTAKDLTGKKIAINSFNGCAEYMFYEYLRENGISNPKESANFITMPDTQQEQALRQGLVDAVFTHPSTGKKLENRGGVRKIFDDSQLHTELGMAVYFFADKFIEEHPDVIKGFVAAIGKSQDWVDGHREEAYQIFANASGWKLQDVEGNYYREHALITDDAVQPWIDTLERYGAIKTGQVKLSDVYTNKFNPNAKDQASVKAKALTPVRVPTPQGFSELFIAEEKGFFENEGLKIEYAGVLTPAQTAPAVLKGDIDFAVGHATTMINQIAGGAKIRSVVARTQTVKGYPHMSWYVTENSSIRTVQDIVGKKIAVAALGACTEYMTLEYLRLNGISDPKGKFEFVTMPDSQAEQALKQGLVDVVGIHDPYSTKLSKTSGFRLLFDDTKIHDGNLGMCTIFTSEKFINEHPDTVRKFVAAIAKAEDWNNANHAEANKIVAKKLQIEEINVGGLNYYKHGLFVEEPLQTEIDTLIRYERLTPGQISPQDVYTNEFNPYYKT